MLIFLFFLTCAAGCTSVRTADTHNISVAVQNYNSWVSGQKEFDRMTRDTFTLMSDHVSTYNTEIAKDHPDYPLLRENLAQDQQLLDQWGTRLDALTAATDSFDQDTAALTYDNATVTQTRNTLGLMTQYMKIYSVDMGNARQYLIDYVNNADAYIGPDDPDYWNDNYRQKALRAKEQAVSTLAESDGVLKNITEKARDLQNLQ